MSIAQEFEDLDEIIARFVQPMAANARDLLAHKNYREVGGKKELVEDMLKQSKKATPSRIPYHMTASRTLPGWDCILLLACRRHSLAVL